MHVDGSIGRVLNKYQIMLADNEYRIINLRNFSSRLKLGQYVQYVPTLKYKSIFRNFKFNVGINNRNSYTYLIWLYK